MIAPAGHIPVNSGASADDGIYVTDTSTGNCKLLVSLGEIVAAAGPALATEEYAAGDFFGFHVKWNPQGDRILFVLRWRSKTPGAKLKHNAITLRSDGSDIRIAIPETRWGKGGHHPNWCPDGKTVMMNLILEGTIMRLVKAAYDGSSLTAMSTAVVGSGHPTLHPDNRHVLTDVYAHEPQAFGDGTAPIRWIDLTTGDDRALVRIDITPDFAGPRNEMRIDPHPAWDRDFRRIAFNGRQDGSRRVFVADLSEMLR